MYAPVPHGHRIRQPIDEIELGDQVLATDATTGRTPTRPVLGPIAGNGSKHLAHLTVDTDRKRNPPAG